MRILVLAPQLPWPPHQGTALRNLNILLLLAKRHSVTLLCFGDADAALGRLDGTGIETVLIEAPPARSMLRRLIDMPTTPTPDLVRRLGSPAMDAAVDRVVAASASGPRFDVVQIEGMEMAGFGLRAYEGLARAQAQAPRLVYDAHNAEWLLQDRAWRSDVRRPRGWIGAIYSRVQTAKIRRFESGLLRKADATVVVSQADAEALEPLAPRARLVVVPNGVDVEDYPPADPARADRRLCVFTGKMDFRPNIDAVAWFCQQVWPRVRARQPEMHLAIVGRDPVPRVRALEGRDTGVEVTGAVPDVQPWIERAGVIVVPLRVGGGTRLKVLEAMSMQKAIVATTLGAEGLDLVDGCEIEIADEPERMAERIIGLSGDPDRRLSLGRRARARAESDYRWAVLVPRIEALFEIS